MLGLLNRSHPFKGFIYSNCQPPKVNYPAKKTGSFPKQGLVIEPKDEAVRNTFRQARSNLMMQVFESDQFANCSFKPCWNIKLGRKFADLP